MTISEFLKGRNVERQAITRYINRHEDEFDGHITKTGREIELDEDAIRILERKYPLPAPVEIIIDHESRDKLLEAQERIIQLQQTVCELQKQLTEHERTKFLLEDAENRLSVSESKNRALEEELILERSKSWLQKLLRK